MNRILLIFVCAHLLLQMSFAQTITFKGSVLDNRTKLPIEYASVELWSSDSVFLKGVATDKEGKYQLIGSSDKKPFLKIFFIGYQPSVRVPTLIKGEKEVELGITYLVTISSTMQAVIVEGQKRVENLQVDKKIISAKQFQIAQNGTAIDLLQKIASFTVSNEGEIALRGSTGFIVFINGKRSNREASAVLAQLPANIIETIEIITSPSARYDADGKTGIINIVTKKNIDEGWSVSGNSMFAGINPQRFGGDLMVTYSKNRWLVYAGGDYRRYDFNGRRIGVVRTMVNDTVTYMPSDGARNFMEYQYSIRAGSSYSPNEANIFNLSFYAGEKRSDRTANLHYQENSQTGSNNLYENNFIATPFPFYNHNLFGRTGEFKTVDLDYTHTFRNKNKLTLLGLFEHSVLGGPLNNQDFYEGTGTPYQNEYSTEKSPLNGLRMQVDYVMTLTKQLSLSTGYQFRELRENGYFFYDRMDTTTAGAYFKDPSFNDSIHLKQQIHAGYVQLDGQYKKLTYDIGLRAEYMNRVLQGHIDPSIYTYNKLNWFPSMQGLVNLEKRQKLRLGFSRRIEWANVKMLSPFKNHRHEETIEVGDPALRPEISTILEFSYNKSWKKIDFTATAYYNKIIDKVFRVNGIYTRTIVYRGYTNAGNTSSTGLELSGGIRIADWWRLNVSGNIYDYKISGMYKENSIRQNSINYNANVSTTLEFSSLLKFQWGFSYTSNTVTSQGHDTHLFLSTAGGRYSILDKKGYIGLQVNNIFNSNSQTIVTQGSDFYSSTQYIKYDRAVQVSFGWQLNNSIKKAKSTKTDYGEKEF